MPLDSDFHMKCYSYTKQHNSFDIAYAIRYNYTVNLPSLICCVGLAGLIAATDMEISRETPNKLIKKLTINGGRLMTGISAVVTMVVFGIHGVSSSLRFDSFK